MAEPSSEEPSPLDKVFPASPNSAVHNNNTTTVNHNNTRNRRVQLERSSSSIQFPASAMALAHKSKTSSNLLTGRCLSSSNCSSTTRRVSLPSTEDPTWVGEDRCMEYGTPPPIEEPHCYSMCLSESSFSEESSCAVQINRDYLKGLLVEHTRTLGCRLLVVEELEAGKLDLASADKYLEGCKKPQELNALLLYASFLGFGELIPIVHNHGADLNHSEPELGMTALHLCAFSNCLSGVRYLLGHNVHVGSKKAHTPYHFAAFGNAIDVAKFFAQLGWSQESPLGEETVLHAAARNNALDVLRLLAPKNPTLNRLDSAGYAAIHYAAERGDSGCLKVLLAAGCLVNVSTRKGETALHLSAEAGCAESLELLLAKGANPAVRNRRGQTALHLAARTHSLECVEALLQHSRSEPNAEDHDGRTPLHVALGRSLLAYDVTEMLISWKAQVNKPDKYGYTPLHVAALNELSQCVDILIQHGADLSAKTKGGTSALSIILRKTPSSLNCFKQRLDASISMHQHGSAAGEVELRLDFHPLLQHQQQGEIGYLGTFVKEGYKEILEHPLCQSFLHLKWQKIRKYYVGRLLFYLLYVLVLTAWVITALAHNCYNESHGQLDNSSRPLCANSTGLNGFLYRHPVVLEVEWYALVVLTVLEGLRKLMGILTYSTVRQFFTQAENMVEWCVIVSVFATSFVYTGRTYTWQSHVGAFAVLCGWSNLMLMIGQLPMFGAYVAMFTSVQAQVFKLLLAYACLLVGFTASFCVIFPRSKSFSSPHTGLIKVLVMMTGELDFEELFFPGEEEGGRPVDVGGTSWILLQVSAQLSFVLFLLFVTIVLMNLLVGIAVHDIKGLQKTAGLAKLVRQTKLICDLETALFLGLLPQCLMKVLRWTALVLPSPLKAVLTVRPLNPREKRLPRDVLAGAYKVARERKGNLLNSTLSSKRSNNSTIYGYQKFDLNASVRRRTNMNEEPATTLEEAARLKEEVAELRKICESNNLLIQELVKSFTFGK
ncbi:transient receptor potential channel pyrexia [Nasonia vitripennis]|uniref:Ion transport domain-containing protein n=1 Tax=Nasonia vitripennis TaxID=7425 RepID=A0A7M7H6L8_NASVI|nr:transient receptor potential channel pyrexia [Nasonia vitripennis]XP_016839799.1 transient receptor potential channel pyrexia [Nasonia vitripennis]